MALDFKRIFDLIQSRLHADESIADDMNCIIACCEQSCPHNDWAKMRELPYAEDLQKLQKWLPRAFANPRIITPIVGLWFGLFNPVYRSTPTADIRVSGSRTYDASDVDLTWATEAQFHPERGAAKSRVMNAIYRQAYKNDTSLRNNAEWPLCLAYGTFLVKRIAVPDFLPDLRAESCTVGIAVGFDGGDYLTVGSLSSSGLTLATKDA